jgi:hypothetical protein
MAAFRSRLANDIVASKHAFLIKGNDTGERQFHLAPLGISHSICFARGEGNLMCFRDLRNVLVKRLKLEKSSDNTAEFTTKSAASDETLRNNQADMFITLVLDVRRSEASSIELATPALYALQMLLQSHWQPANCFTTEFLEVLVSLLNSYDISDHASSINRRNGSSAIAEDIISTLFRKRSGSSDLMLDVLFKSLRGDSSVLCTTAQISILSQALGAYVASSLQMTIADFVNKMNTMSERELLGKSQIKVDFNWRRSLNLGDTLEIPAYDGSFAWITASIVKIDYKTDMLTLEYRAIRGAPTTGEGYQFDSEPLQLLQVARSTGRIRPIESSSERVELDNSEQHLRSAVRFSDSEGSHVDATVSSSTDKSSSIMDSQHFVTSNHRAVVGLLFDSMKLERHMSAGGETRSPLLKRGKEGTPKCAQLHQMEVTALYNIAACHHSSQHPFVCDCCGSVPTAHRVDGPRGWYCDMCRFHICFSCFPEPSESMHFSKLQGRLNPMSSSMRRETSHMSIQTSTPQIFDTAFDGEYDSTRSGAHSSFYDSGDRLQVDRWSAPDASNERTNIDRISSRTAELVPSSLSLLTPPSLMGGSFTQQCIVEGKEEGEGNAPHDQAHNKSAEKNYGISDMVELTIKLDKARKEEIIQSQESAEGLKGEEGSTDQVDFVSAVSELLTCALVVFKRVIIYILV